MNKFLPLATVIALCSAPASASVEVDGQTLEVIDMHLHPGTFGTLNPTGKAFVLSNVPPFLTHHAPALLGAGIDPYTEFVGIVDETRSAGVDHGVLYAVYTHHTTGHYTNTDLAMALLDPRNDGWGWGFVSVNLDDVEGDDALLEAGLDAMASYVEARPDLFVGIKLAHAHQGVRLDSEASFRVYERAGALGVPVLLHTGFSPFPNTQDESEFYDPAFLMDIVSMFDGMAGPRVDFVLSHVGQGDARSVESALTLASMDNVWIELSALARPLQIDEDGNPIESDELQLASVVQAVLDRGLTHKALFASDGPQLSSFVEGYLAQMVSAMVRSGYSTPQIADVLAGNFRALYLE
ncbi:MAG: amidohydrolase family protein [Nannocystaceae bacterium]|nr:amidohydrolase [bacterium]